MEILVIHGDHTLKSYEKLRDVIDTSKTKGWLIQKISEGDKLSFPEVLTGQELFEYKRLLVVEEINKIKKNDLDWLATNNKTLDGFLVLYSASTIAKSVLKLLPKGYKTEEFRLPKLIWRFLESFYPGNTRVCLELLHEVVKTEPDEFVFALLARHLRDLYWVKDTPKSLPYPSWRVGKLKVQVKRFNNGKLKMAINSLSDIDIKVKTSKAELISSLDFLIATHLE